MQKIIGAIEHETGNIEYHAHIGGEYTLCGTAIDGDMFSVVDVPDGQKIDCKTCRHMFEDARRFRASDFQK